MPYPITVGIIVGVVWAIFSVVLLGPPIERYLDAKYPSPFVKARQIVDQMVRIIEGAYPSINPSICYYCGGQDDVLVLVNPQRWHTSPTCSGCRNLMRDWLAEHRFPVAA